MDTLIRELAHVFVVVAIVGSILACESPSQRAPESPSASRLSWNRISGATRYEIRAWSEYRLLLEEATPETTLALPPAWAATLASFDSVTVQVRAYDALGQQVGKLQARRWAPGGSAR